MTNKNNSEKILIIDDEERMCLSLVAILKDLGYQAKAVSQANQALKEIEKDNYDLIVSDIKMPDLDGFDILKLTKRQNKDSLVIFMTGYASLESAIQAINLGAYDYLTKPLDFGKFRLTVQRALEKREYDQSKNLLLEALKQKNLELKQKVSELNALYQTGKSLSSTADLKQLLNQIISLATKVIGAKTGSVMLINPENRELYISAAIGLEKEVIQNTRLKMGSSIAGYVAEKGTPLMIEDVEKDIRFRRINKQKYETKSLLSVPLKIKNKVLGVINLNNKVDGTSFSKSDLQLLTTFASQAAVSIESAYIFEQMKRKNQELNLLYDIATGVSHLQDFREIASFIFAKLKKLLPLDFCFWLDWEPETEKISLGFQETSHKNFKIRELELPLKKNKILDWKKLRSKLFHHLKPYFGKEFAVEHLVVVPILTEGTLQGIFCLGNRKSQVLSESDYNLISIVASQSASVYEREKAILNATRLVTMGNMIFEITHDLKKPLTNIKGSLQILRQKNTLNKDTQRLLDPTEEEIFRLTELVKELVNFSNPGKYQPERKALLPILEKAISLVESDSISGKIVIKKDFVLDLPPVFVNEKEILESFLNLIFNAIESMPKGGELKVRAKQTYLSEQEKEFIQVTISDQGMGIAPENLHRIFERYFTTKDGGTGLGLAVVDRIIKAHNGFVSVESQPQVGTTFEVFLPI